MGFQKSKDEPKQESNLITHARRELQLIGEDPYTIAGYLNVIQAFADMNHSGGSAIVATSVIHKLLQYKNLWPLTNDPDEWQEHGPETWDGVNSIYQNKRNAKAFSGDGGKSYYLVSDDIREDGTRPTYIAATSSERV